MQDNHEHGLLRKKDKPSKKPDWLIEEEMFSKERGLDKEKEIQKIEEEIRKIENIIDPEQSTKGITTITIPEGVRNPDEYYRKSQERLEFLKKRRIELGGGI